MRGALEHETRQWIEQATGGRIVRRRRLHGGIIARVDELVVARGDQTHAFVLRRYEDDPKAVAYEARILAALEAVDLPTPRLVGTDASALLMTKLSGHLDLCAQDLSAKLRAMAAALPVLHAADVLRPVGVRLRLNPRSYEWVRDAGLRRAAEAVVATPPARLARVPTHGDFQHFNMLWARGALTGIVDWSGIWLGPPEIDVCHCRLNLAVLYSPDVAEEFRLAYEAAAGRAVDPWHDVHRLGVYGPEWPQFIPIQVHGRAPVPRGMTARVEQLLRHALARF